MRIPTPDAPPRPSLEPLETRLAPPRWSARPRSPTRTTDGDAVAIRSSRPIFPSEAAANAILTFSVGSVNGTNLVPQQLQERRPDRRAGPGDAAERHGVSTRSPAATDWPSRARRGIRPRPAHSDRRRRPRPHRGRRRQPPHARPGRPAGRVAGRRGHLDPAARRHPRRPTSAVRSACSTSRATSSTPPSSPTATPSTVGDRFGTIGKVFVGGDLVGGGADNSGSIFASGGLGPIHVGGGIIGGDGSGSGSPSSLSFSRGIGPVYVGIGFLGGGGDGSGGINSNGPIASVLIGGSIVGGTVHPAAGCTPAARSGRSSIPTTSWAAPGPTRPPSTAAAR